jgi:hypothetical protein
MPGLVGTGLEFLGAVLRDKLYAVNGFLHVFNRDKQSVLEGFQPVCIEHLSS